MISRNFPDNTPLGILYGLIHRYVNRNREAPRSRSTFPPRYGKYWITFVRAIAAHLSDRNNESDPFRSPSPSYKLTTLTGLSVAVF